MHALVVLLFLLTLVAPAWADPPTHARPDETRQRQQWFGDHTAEGFAVSGCSPSVPGGLTFAAFGCEGYVKDTSTGEILYAQESSAAPTALSGGNGTYWLALRANPGTTPAGWTCTAGTRYCWKLSSSVPASPTRALVFAEVTVSGGAITAVYNQAASNPRGTIGAGDTRYGMALAASAASNTTALQSALNHSTQAGRVLELPCGTYAVTAGLTFPDLGGNRKNQIRVQGCGAPDLVYDGNADPPERSGTVLTCAASGTSACLSLTLSGLSSALTTVSLADFQLVGPGASGGHGLHLVGDGPANGRLLRINLRNLAIRLFQGTNMAGFRCFFCENGSAYNLTLNYNSTGLYLEAASNANTFYNLVAQNNLEYAVYLTNVTTDHFFGGLLQHNQKTGFYLVEAAQVVIAGFHFEDNNSTNTAGKYAIHLQGEAAKFVSETLIEGNRFAAARDVVYADGDATGTVVSTLFLANRWQVANPGVILNDANVIGTILMPSPGVTNNGANTVFFGGTGANQLGRLGLGQDPTTYPLQVNGTASATSFTTTGDYNLGAGYVNFNGNPANPTTVQGAIYAQAGIGPTITGLNFEVRTHTTTPVRSFFINQEGAVFLRAIVAASLPASGNGALYFCSDCTIANPCAGGGTGALAKRLNGAWVCN